MDVVESATFELNEVIPFYLRQPSGFLDMCLETAEGMARTITADEVSRMHDSGLLPSVLEYIWQYSGHFYRWPQQLLTRDDLPDAVRKQLTINLNDELGLSGTLPHSVLFKNFAASLGVPLSTEQPPGRYLTFILSQAASLPAPIAIGQLFANEATPKWRGFAEALEQVPGVDLEFFDVHSHDLDHCRNLPEGFELEELPQFWNGSIQFSQQLAAYMNGVRDLTFL